MEITKVHEDERRSIHVVEKLLPDNKEFTFIHLKKGKAIGGCIHSTDEYYTIIHGKVKILLNDFSSYNEIGAGGMFKKNEPHAMVAIEDSIIIEWGVDKSKPENNRKDSKMRAEVDRING